MDVIGRKKKIILWQFRKRTSPKNACVQSRKERSCPSPLCLPHNFESSLLAVSVTRHPGARPSTLGTSCGDPIGAEKRASRRFENLDALWKRCGRRPPQDRRRGSTGSPYEATNEAGVAPRIASQITYFALTAELPALRSAFSRASFSLRACKDLGPGKHLHN